MSELISWIDMDTLLLLFSMMVLVAIIAETGVFDWLAVCAYKVRKTNWYMPKMKSLILRYLYSPFIFR